MLSFSAVHYTGNSPLNFQWSVKHAQQHDCVIRFRMFGIFSDYKNNTYL